MAEIERHICKVSFYEIDEIGALIDKAMEGYSEALKKADEKGLVIKNASVYKDLIDFTFVFTFKLAKPNPFAFMSNDKDHISEADFYKMLKKTGF